MAHIHNSHYSLLHHHFTQATSSSASSEEKPDVQADDDVVGTHASYHLQINVSAAEGHFPSCFVFVTLNCPLRQARA